MCHNLFYSTNLKSERVNFWYALMKGQAPDKGLYMPENIPVLTKEEIESFSKKEYYQIAYDIISKFLLGDIENDYLYKICKEAYNYSVPLENIYNRHYIMRLDQGPTASFKDFAARLMGRLMQYCLKKEKRKLLILTATSGDTGSAIANAFYGLDNIDVVILFPLNEVTDRQRKQMTTLQQNIKIVGLDGKFDDCQALVKLAFADQDLQYLPLSSANSINIGRLLPQSVYYFWAFSQLSKNINDKIIFSVPSGNFGDLMGGIIAREMGLPIEKFVISTNENDEVPEYFAKEFYKPIVPSINCISSAMNVGHPSNLARIVALYNGQMDEKGIVHKYPNIAKMKNDFFAVSVTDTKTRETIKEIYLRHKIILEPHGAVGWAGLQSFLNENKQFNSREQLTITLETAHPAKFPKEIKEILRIEPELPSTLSDLENKEEKLSKVNNNYEAFKNFLITNYK